MSRNFLMTAAALFVAVSAAFTPVSGKEYYEWNDDMGVHHITDEFSKVPPEYRSRTTVKGAKKLAESVEQLHAEQGLARPGYRLISLDDISASFELPENFGVDKGTWKEEDFLELGRKKGEQGQRFYSNQSVDVEIVTLPGEKSSSRLSAIATGILLAGDYGKLHAGESIGLMTLVKSAVVLPSSHIVLSAVPAVTDPKTPVFVQFISGPSGTAWVRWKGPSDEVTPVSQESLVSWRHHGDPFRFGSVAAADLENPLIQGTVAVVIVLLAVLAGIGIWIVKTRDD